MIADAGINHEQIAQVSIGTTYYLMVMVQFYEGQHSRNTAALRWKQKGSSGKQRTMNKCKNGKWGLCQWIDGWLWKLEFLEPFTNDLWAKTFNFVNIHYLVIMIIMTQSGHKCTHVWQLSCHGMCKIVTWSDQNFHIRATYFFKIWTMSSENVCELCFCSLVQSIFNLDMSTARRHLNISL